MERIDLKKDLKHLYQPSAKEVVQVEVPTFGFLMVDGEGDPNTSQQYAQAVEALFFCLLHCQIYGQEGPQKLDYAVMPLEGLWWADDMSAFAAHDKTKWKWTMMIMQPAFVGSEIIEAAIAEVRAKKKLSAIDKS